MKMNTEIITLVIVLVLLYTRPSALVRFSNTLLGKVLFVSAVIIASLVNPLAGLFFATLMIVLMEQSYEGFKEGNTPIVLPIQVNTVGSYVKDTKLITVKPVNTTTTVKAGNIPLNKSTLTHNGTDTFDEHTLIKNATDTITIGVDNNDKITETIPNSTIQIITSIDNNNNTAATEGDYIKYTDSNNDSIVNKVASIDANNTITFEDATSIDNTVSYNIVTVIDVTTDSKEYKPDDTNVGFKYITITTTETIDTTSELILPSNKVVAINSVDDTINLTISAGVKSDNLDDGIALSIADHTHIHEHDDNESFVGGRKEGFFAGDSKKETAVKGAYAEETYEDEIVGETVCSSDLCDRIDSEFKLIRPINSNDHTPTNV